MHDSPGCPKQMKLNKMPMIQCPCICTDHCTKAECWCLGQPGFSKGMLTMRNVRFKALTNVFLNSTASFWVSSTQIYVLLTQDKEKKRMSSKAKGSLQSCPIMVPCVKLSAINSTNLKVQKGTKGVSYP